MPELGNSMKDSRMLPLVWTGLLFSAFGLSMTFPACSGSNSSASAPPPPAQAGLGGSNYMTYHLDPPCNREPYGVVYNYDTATATINSQLQQMYNNGQRRLRIPIFHGRGINSGTVMDSTAGDLASR